jgi:hypothetical protein
MMMMMVTTTMTVMMNRVGSSGANMVIVKLIVPNHQPDDPGIRL